MSNKDEALKMVNQVLDDKHHYPDEAIPTLVMDALNACKEALEQPTVAKLNDEYLRDTYVEGLNQPAQEPVNNCPNCGSWFTKEIHSIPTHQWQGLTDDEINETVRNVSDDMYPWKGNMLIGKIIRAIEAKLKDKNT